MNRFIDIIPSRCVACSTCRAACSAGHAAAGYQSEPRLTVIDNRSVAASMTCHHCEGAPCYKVCPTNSIRKDDDGCIRVDEAHCIGCKMCAIACPFGAIHMAGTGRSGVAGIEYATPTYVPNLDPVLRWEVGVYPVAVKCDLCEYNNYVPKCVEACITDALRLVELNEDDPDYEAKKLRQVQAEQIIFENIDQAIPEGIGGLDDRFDALTYLNENKRVSDEYLQGLADLGVDTSTVASDPAAGAPYNQVVERVAANPPVSDAVAVVESAQRERFLKEIESIPASERSRQVDTDNVIDQLSVGVSIPDIAAHATAYKRALDVQDAEAASGQAPHGVAEEAQGGLQEGADDAGVVPDDAPGSVPPISHGDQLQDEGGVLSS